MQRTMAQPLWHRRTQKATMQSGDCDAISLGPRVVRPPRYVSGEGWTGELTMATQDLFCNALKKNVIVGTFILVDLPAGTRHYGPPRCSV